MAFLRVLLFPFSILYGGILSIRSLCFNLGILKTTTFFNRVISIGNIAVGGTGKTPHTDYLVNLFHSKNKEVAVLSRGYGRRTKGYLKATSSSTAEMVGDEPLLLYKKHQKHASVHVCEDRVFGARQIFQGNEKVTLLLDDAYQHRYIDRDINILLTDYNQLFYRDFVMPTGRLREFKRAAKRANIILVTKTPTITSQEKDSIKKAINKYAKQIPVFFTELVYEKPQSIGKTKVHKIKKVHVFHGLANGNSLKEYVTSQYELASFSSFPDHHMYTERDLDKVIDKWKASQDSIILTTEKDSIKIKDTPLEKLFNQIPFYYLPISVSFQNLEEEERFQKIMLD
ncbi:MAG: tetraacyldisaccharide 4'-kinase [Cyclobacteriaceae bacterium]